MTKKSPRELARTIKCAARASRASSSVLRVLTAMAWSTVVAGLSSAEERLEFSRDIRPILGEYCLACHGFDPEHREADLRLDTREGAIESGAVIPGSPEGSELLRRVLSSDADEVMPPTHTEKQLSPEQIQRLRSWIEQGAEFDQHWAWRPLSRPDLPDPSAQTTDRPPHSSTRSPIDSFLESAWQAHELEPVGLASPREQLRRLSLDLRGLLPTAEEVATFEREPTTDRFLSFRDRWMTELAYAEHQAVPWLDLVRWADTSGFVSDEPIASGAYRAWVIRAIHDNLPFNQFSIYQLAGDLLPTPSDEQLVASGYNRLVNTNCEAGAIEQEQLYKLKGEHVRAVGTVWLGLTTGCAECHDHKFDPFSAKDYYSLAAYFDDLVEAGVYTPGDRREPLHYVHAEPSDRNRDMRLSRAIEDLKQRISAKSTAEQTAWEREIRERLQDKSSRSEFVWITSQLPAARVQEGEFRAVDVQDPLSPSAAFVVRETEVPDGQFHRHHAAELITGYVNGHQTDASQDAWYVDVWIDDQRRPEMIGFQISNGRYVRLGWQSASYETYYWGDDTAGHLESSAIWSDAARIRRMGDLPTDSGWIRLRVPFQDRLAKVSGKSFEAVGMAWIHSGGRVRWGNSGLELRSDHVAELQLGEVAIRKWWEQPMNRQIFERRSKYVAAAVRTEADQRDAVQREVVQDAYRSWTQPQKMSRLRELEGELFALRARATPVLVSRSGKQRKTTRLLNRGDYQDDTGPILQPALPEFLTTARAGATTSDSATPEPAGPPQSRLDLATWLFEDGSDLVARVYVNRLWHRFYGRGFSGTLEDAGTQGEWPSHPELLDWLAYEFRHSGWDRKHMVRLLTSARAYRLSSTPSSTRAQRDGDNRWHARGSRYRRSAESIRDTALQAAGLLQVSTDVPRRSFFPYQPSAYWTRSDKIMFGSRHMLWNDSPDHAQYQRSLYTFWKRQNIHPTMLAFDAPTRQECTAKRNITNTPAQALALLNDPIFVEAARGLAVRIGAGVITGDDRELLAKAFRLTLQRTPTQPEQQILLELLESQRQHYRQHSTDAETLISVGQLPATEESAASEVAAWTVVARTILNMHEFLNRP